MKAYILSIAGVVLLSAVITVISPGGKMGKFLRGAVKLLILVVMLSPFVSWLGGNHYTFSSGNVLTDETYLERCAEILAEGDERGIGDYLAEEFSVAAEVTVSRNAESGFSRKKITVKITDFGIIGQDKHIDMMRRIEDALEKKYGCPAEVA